MPLTPHLISLALHLLFSISTKYRCQWSLYYARYLPMAGLFS